MMESLIEYLWSWTSVDSYSYVELAMVGVVGAIVVQQVVHAVMGAISGDVVDVGGKHVVITGGSEGMGLSFAKLAVGAGASVTIIGRSQAKLDAAVGVLEAEASACGSSGFVHGVSADVTSPSAVASAFASAEAASPVALLVANAGYSATGYFLDLEEKDFVRSMDVNYHGVVRSVKAVVPAMLARREGHVAIISSAMALCGMLGFTAYAPTKWALRGFADSVRQELAPFGVGVSICYPSDVATPGFDVENETKPPETAAMSESAELLTPDQAAQVMWTRILKGEYHIGTETGIDLLSYPMAAMSPRSNPVAAVLLSPIVSIITWFIAREWDGIVVKGARDGRDDIRRHISPMME